MTWQMLTNGQAKEKLKT